MFSRVLSRKSMGKKKAEHELKVFRDVLEEEGMSRATIQKYLRDVRNLLDFAGERRITNTLAVAWREDLLARGYSPASVNSMVVAVNRYLESAGKGHMHLRLLRIQRRAYTDDSKELSLDEYKQLLHAAQPDRRLFFLLETMACTGIRVSELRAITAEAVQTGRAVIRNKGKIREILLPEMLRGKLLAYAEERGIHGSEPIFQSSGGYPLDRSRIWSSMKSLCYRANVDPSKVYPHNLRKLFARTYYSASKDIVKLADVLGHSSIDTTRIYLVSTGKEHRQQLDHLDLVT